MTCPEDPREGDSMDRGNARVLDAVAGQGCSALGAGALCSPGVLRAPSSSVGDLDARTLLVDPQ